METVLAKLVMLRDALINGVGADMLIRAQVRCVILKMSGTVGLPQELWHGMLNQSRRHWWRPEALYLQSE